ncbi:MULTISPECIES: hypothetical protein [unclassified Streptomyces]|uniref:hypothetical protein n=1 Tax=unclassified Streptomyces TaxID=2593676 RepID=UPI0027409DAD|nr:MULTISPECIES: hypothetical protein [unclassified Streptomyces]
MPVDALSDGEQSGLNLPLSLKQAGSLLLLDGPTNELDTEILTSLENVLPVFPGCVMATAHDRSFGECLRAAAILFHTGIRDHPPRSDRMRKGHSGGVGVVGASTARRAGRSCDDDRPAQHSQ